MTIQMKIIQECTFWSFRKQCCGYLYYINMSVYGYGIILGC